MFNIGQIVSPSQALKGKHRERVIHAANVSFDNAYQVREVDMLYKAIGIDNDDGQRVHFHSSYFEAVGEEK